MKRKNQKRKEENVKSRDEGKINTCKEKQEREYKSHRTSKFIL
jgi:hypothetical protein